MADQNIRVNIQFNADNSQAKKSINELSATLNQISQTEITISNGSIDQAVKSANQLHTALAQAVNVDTGRLDFAKLQSSLKAANTDLITISSNLIALGPQGQQAFNQLTRSISLAEAPARRLNSTLIEFGSTLIRTIRWQVASTLIHGFVGTVKEAVNYIEDLNKSLTRIQAVTQQNTAAMTNFANQARNLAGELRVATKDYIDASLIFFQQGLSTNEVIDRTNITMKLAKLTGESVAAVSSELTAIWNNFDNGAQSLEYYVDIVTALGAATAASSQEIATGLQKFAAVADTVGLSYEKATAALATVVAETRQSAEIVGTAFKTIFARLQGLSLGDTLEDGVNLNKYSAALEKVGVDILNQSNELKNMDDILDELGDKWQLLTQAQKVALAETVAGTRQYAQFMAIMENYDEILSNQKLAENAEGTLEAQYEVYKDSIEAITQEFENSKKKIFDQLINENTIKSVKKFLTEVMDIVSKLLKNIGGVKGLIMFVMLKLTSTFMPQIQTGVSNLISNFKDYWGITESQQTHTLINLKKMVEAAREFNNVKNSAISTDTNVQTNSKTNQVNANTSQIDSAKVKQNNLEVQAANIVNDKLIMRNKLEDEILQKRINLTRYGRLMFDTDKEAAVAQIDELERRKNILDLELQSLDALREERATAEDIVSSTMRRQEALSNPIPNYSDELNANNEISKHLSTFNDKPFKNITGEEKEAYKEDVDKTKAMAQNRSEQSGVEAAAVQEQIDQLQNNINDLSDIEKQQAEKRIKELEAEKKELETLKQEYDDYLKDMEKIKDLSTGSGLRTAVNKSKEITDKDTSRLASKKEEAINNVAEAGQATHVVDSTQAQASYEAGKATVNDSLMVGKDIASEANQIFEAATKGLGEIDGKLDSSRQNLKTLNTNYGELNGYVKGIKQITADTDVLMKKEAVTSKNLTLTHSQRKKLEEQSNKAYNTLGKNLKKVFSSTTNIGQAMKGQLKTSIQQISNAKIRTGELNKTKINVDKINEALDSGEGFKNLSPEEIQVLREALSNLETAGRQAMSGIDETSQGVQRDLQAAGDGSDRYNQSLQNIVDTSRNTSEVTERLRQDLANINEEADKGPKSNLVNTFTQGLQKVTQTASQVQMGLTMLTTGTEQLTEAFGENGSTMQKVTAIMMLLQGASALFNAMQSITSIVVGVVTKVINKLSKSEEKNTVVKWGNVAATIAQRIAESGWAGIALGIALAATIALTAAIIISTAKKTQDAKATEEANKKMQENAEANDKAADAIMKTTKKWKEETDALDELLIRYNSLSEAEQNLWENRKDIIEQSKELLAGYEEAKDLFSGEDLKTYTALVEQYKTAISMHDIPTILSTRNKLDNMVAPAAAKGAVGKSNSAYGSEKLNMAKNLRELANNEEEVQFDSGGNMVVRVAGHDGGKEANQGFAKELKEELISSGEFEDSDIDDNKTWGNDWWGAEVKFSADPQQFEKQYHAFEKAVNNLSSKYKNAQNFTRMSKWISDNTESMEKITQANTDARSYTTTASANTLANSGQSISNIHSLGDYNNFRKNLIQENQRNGLSEVDATTAANNYLKEHEGLSLYDEAFTLLDGFEQKFGPMMRASIENGMKNLNEDELSSLLSLDLDLNTVYDKESFNAAVEVAKRDAQNNKLESSLEITADLKTKIDKNDTQALQESYTKFLEKNPDAMDWNGFSLLSRRDQKAYINSYETQAIKTIRNNKRADIESRASQYAHDQAFLNGGSVALREYYKSQKNDIATRIENKNTALEDLRSKRNATALEAAKDALVPTFDILNQIRDDDGGYDTIGLQQLTFEDDFGRTETYDIDKLMDQTLGNLRKAGIDTSDFEQTKSALLENGLGSSEVWHAFLPYISQLSNDSEYADWLAGSDVANLDQTIATTEDQIAALQQVDQDYSDSIEAVDQQEADARTRIASYSEDMQELAEIEQSYLTALASSMREQIANASTLSELDSVMANIGNEFINNPELMQQLTEAYQDQLITLAADYANCASEIEAFNQAIQTGNQELIASAQEALKASLIIGEASEKYGLNADAVEEQSRQIAKDYGIVGTAAAQLAIRNQRMNAGVAALNKDFQTWAKTLKSTDKLSTDYAEAMDNMTKAVRNLVGAADDAIISADFIETHLGSIEAAANGSEEAIAKLGNELVHEQIALLTYNNVLESMRGEVDEVDFNTWQQTLMNGIDALHDKLKDLEDGADLGEILGEDWINALNEMAKATGMSVEQMQGMLNSLGVQGEVHTETAEVERNIPQYETTTYIREEDSDKEDYDKKVVELTSTHQTGTVPVTETIEYASLGTVEGGVQKPLIYRSPKSSGGVSTSSTSAGSNSSKKEKKDKKKSEKETERYHEITALIEDYSKELEKAGKAKDKAFGPAKIKAMQAEIAAQAQLNAGTEEYIREIEQWLAIDKERIQSQGAVFDEYGNISNYTDLMQQHIDKYNEAVATYNASSQDDTAKENFEKAEQAYSDFIEQLKQYEDTNNLLQEQQETLLDGLQQIYDLTTQKNQYIIEFKIQADDDAIAFIDYLKNKLENFTDGVNDAAEKLAYLNEEAARLMSKNSTYNEAIDMTLQHYLGDQKGWDQSAIDAYVEKFKNNALTEADMSALEDMSEEEFNYLREMRDNLLEINNLMIENMNAVVETVQESFTKTAEDLDKAARPIERAASALENYAAIIDIVGRDALGITDTIAAELDNAAVAVAHSATVAAKAKVDTLQGERENVQRLYDEAMAQGLTEMAYKWKTVLEEMDDEIASATDDFNSKWQDELTKAREAFENTVERIKQNMLDAFAGSIGSWSALKDSMEYAQTAADRFVPQYKEIYELSKLNRDIMKSVDNTSNIKNKQALRDLQKEINELEQHSGEISQYDLDNARRRYELELARLALEEARDAKSTVRLSKDAEGNWSYVYTANQDDVEKAEQNYEDKLYAMQQANNEYINSLSDQILELEEQYAEKLAEIRLDNTMSEEERNAAIERLNAYFAEQMEYLTNEGQKAVDNNGRLFKEEWTTYHNWTDAFGNDTQARIDNQHDFMTQFGDTILGQYTGFGNFDELNSKMVEIAQQASADMETAYQELNDQIATAMETAGYNVETFGQTVSDTVRNEIVPSAQAAEDAVTHMAEEAAHEFETLATNVSDWQKTYATEMQKIINKNERLAKSVGRVTDAYAALVAQMYNAAHAPTPKAPTFTGSKFDGYEYSHEGEHPSGSDPDLLEDTYQPTDLHQTYWTYINDETCMAHIWRNGEWVNSAGGHKLEFDHYDSHFRHYICKQCKHDFAIEMAGGCFDPTTPILMASGEIKPLSDVKKYDKIIAYDEITSTYVIDEVLENFVNHTTSIVYKLFFEDGCELILTAGHPLLSISGWKAIDSQLAYQEHQVITTSLIVGDWLKYNTEFKQVKHIQKIYSPQYDVYNLCVKNYHTFIVNGFIAHNMSIYHTYAKYDTGGYTGDWDSANGKLAILHEKELVLNKDDTKNILGTVEMVRKLSSKIDLNAQTARYAFNYHPIISEPRPIDKELQVDQTVTISAEFPNVQNRTEIEEAFTTLINQASQYANRKS